LAPTDALTPALITSAFTLGRTILPVVVGARLVGIVRVKDIRPSAPPLAAPDTPPLVAHVMKTQFAYVRAEEDLWHAQELLIGADANALPVVEGDSLQGMLTIADIYAARTGAFALTSAEAPILIAGGNLNV
jgi:CBS domain-containing protein